MANAVSSLFPEIQTPESHMHTYAYRGVQLAPFYSTPLKLYYLV